MKLKHLPSILIALAIVVLLVGYMLSFTVRFDETAIRTRFGKANDNSVITTAGIQFKVPIMHAVQTYPKTLQIIEDQPIETQTSDQYSVVLRTYMTWRITDPLAFFRGPRTVSEAVDKFLKPAMAEVTSIVADYEFNELVSTNPDNVKLAEAEAKCLARLSQTVADLGHGIEIVDFGFHRLLLPEQITEKVYERMVATREAFAANTREEGATRARDITNKAEQIASRIEDFARTRAAAIEAEGQEEAARLLSSFTDEPELAKFLLEVDTLRSILTTGKNTYILDARDLDALDMLIRGAAEPAPASR